MDIKYAYTFTRLQVPAGETIVSMTTCRDRLFIVTDRGTLLCLVLTE